MDWEPFVGWMSLFVFVFASASALTLMYSPGPVGVGLIAFTLAVTLAAFGARVWRLRR